jgi:hypothetical protein
MITIDLDRIKEIALKGIRRATVFLGLGVNAARDNTLTKYDLPENQIKFILKKVTPEDISGFKQNFEKWIIWNSLRELIESFGIFLDAIHQSCLLFATNKGRVTPENANMWGPAFERKGVEEKLKTLRTRFKIATNNEKYFVTISQARNCITHRQGRIGKEDLKGSDSFRPSWRAFEIIVQTPDGAEISLKAPLPESGLYLKEGGSVALKVLERLRDYKLGEVIEFTPVDINDICFLVYQSTGELIASILNYAKELGIENAEQSTHADPD